MISIEMAKHQLEIYTWTQCWRGELATPSTQRLSDFFNDQMHDYCNLVGATLLTWDSGKLSEEKTFGTMSVHIKTILAVVRNIDPSPVKADATQRVQKQPAPVLIYAPPFTVEGKMHLIGGAKVFDAIDGARQNFITLTDGMLLLDRTRLMPVPADLVLVNRQWMTAFRSISG